MIRLWSKGNDFKYNLIDCLQLKKIRENKVNYVEGNLKKNI